MWTTGGGFFVPMHSCIDNCIHMSTISSRVWTRRIAKPMTMRNEKAIYACINYGEAICPKEIENRSICIDRDICDVLLEMLEL